MDVFCLKYITIFNEIKTYKFCDKNTTYMAIRLTYSDY